MFKKVENGIILCSTVIFEHIIVMEYGYIIFEYNEKSLHTKNDSE